MFATRAGEAQKKTRNWRKFFVKARRPGRKKFEKSDIELFVEAAYEDADETADEITIEEIVID